MFQVEYINGKYGKTNYWGLLFQITLYWFILKTLHDLFKKQKQEEKFFLPSWSRLSPLSAVFNHQLSNNPKIRVQQEKLIKQKKYSNSKTYNGNYNNFLLCYTLNC
ncbi:hypothetical protein [Candidatus Phytoplasma solani]|uniref:hypothetical protein n=1 Tax=Candidatus Phytoplasma solani TaxID=69896 RepID=UPI00359022A7